VTAALGRIYDFDRTTSSKILHRHITTFGSIRPLRFPKKIMHFQASHFAGDESESNRIRTLDVKDHLRRDPRIAPFEFVPGYPHDCGDEGFDLSRTSRPAAILVRCPDFQWPVTRTLTTELKTKFTSREVFNGATAIA
jgi:hypothetical protein